MCETFDLEEFPQIRGGRFRDGWSDRHTDRPTERPTNAPKVTAVTNILPRELPVIAVAYTGILKLDHCHDA